MSNFNILDAKKFTLDTLRKNQKLDPDIIADVIELIQNSSPVNIIDEAHNWDMILPWRVYNPIQYIIESIPDCLDYICKIPPGFKLDLEFCLELDLEDLTYFTDVEIFLASGFWIPARNRIEWIQALFRARSQECFFLPKLPDIEFQEEYQVEENCPCGATETILGEPVESNEILYAYGTLTQCQVATCREMRQILKRFKGHQQIWNPWKNQPFTREELLDLIEIASYLKDQATLDCIPNIRYSPREHD